MQQSWGSYVKHCAPGSWGTAHTDAAVGDDAPIFANATGNPISYSRHKDVFLAGYAADDDIVRDHEGARARCTELGERCRRLTCDDSKEETCTVRDGTEAVASPAGEVSYVKVHLDKLVEPISAGGGSQFFQCYTGSQSVVRKDRIQLLSKDWLAAMAADGPLCSNYTGYFEAVWHAMFGDPLAQWPRERDPRLPLYLKWGVRSMFSYGDEGVV